MAFMAIIVGLGQLFYILLGFRYSGFKETIRESLSVPPLVKRGLIYIPRSHFNLTNQWCVGRGAAGVGFRL